MAINEFPLDIHSAKLLRRKLEHLARKSITPSTFRIIGERHTFFVEESMEDGRTVLHGRPQVPMKLTKRAMGGPAHRKAHTTKFNRSTP